MTTDTAPAAAPALDEAEVGAFAERLLTTYTGGW